MFEGVLGEGKKVFRLGEANERVGLETILVHSCCIDAKAHFRPAAARSSRFRDLIDEGYGVRLLRSSTE